MPADGLDILRTLAALATVLGLVMLVAWAARRWLPNMQNVGTGRRLSIVESRPLDTKSRLLLVRFDDREHLLVTSPAGTTIIPADSGSLAKTKPESATSGGKIS